MSTRVLRSRWLVVIGLVGMLVGALDPLEGSLIIVPGAGLAALGAFRSRSKRRVLSYWSLALVVTGVGVMWIASAFGGFGGGTGRSLGWGLLILLPYAVGWLLGVIGAVLALIKLFARPPQTEQTDRKRWEPVPFVLGR